MICLPFSSIVKSWSYPTTLIFVSWGKSHSQHYMIHNSLCSLSLANWWESFDMTKNWPHLLAKDNYLNIHAKSPTQTEEGEPLPKGIQENAEILPFNRIHLNANTERQTLQMYPNLNLQYIRKAQFYELPSFMLFYFYDRKINPLINY